MAYTYNQLGKIKVRVKNYLDNRTDIDDDIIEWINDTRRSLALEYDFAYLYTEATCETSAASARYALPSDYLGHLNLFIGTKKLIRLMPNEFDAIHGDTIDITSTDTTTKYLFTTGDLEQDEPDYYIDRGMEFDLYPTPDATYTLLMRYYANPTDWSDDADYDYMSTFHAEAIVFGAALRGAIFLEDDQKVQKFMQIYAKEIEKMQKKEMKKKTSDLVVRWKTFKDYDINQFKRLVKMNNA